MLKSVANQGSKMSEVVLVLGTVAIVGLVAIVSIALVYNRSLWVKGSDNSIEMRTDAEVRSEPSKD